MKDEDSNLIRHAKRELALVGYDDNMEEMDEMMYSAIMELVRTFANQHHTGFSGEYCLQATAKLLRFESLSPLTSDPEEWEEVGDGLWQNRRNSKWFSTDGGRTGRNVEDKDMDIQEMEEAK